jgi:hypothetical protein
MVLIGMLYAPFARETAVPLYRTRIFYASLRLALIFLALVATGYALAPDWMWMYFIPAHAAGATTLVLVFVALYLMPYAAGLHLGCRVFNGRRRAYFAGVAVCAGLQAVLVISLWRRYSQVGTVEEFMAGTAQPLSSAQPLNAILTAGAVVLAAVAWLQWRTFRRDETIGKTRQPGESKKNPAMFTRTSK